MKDIFTIGEISKLFDINKKTLRYYDEIDLFKPNFTDEKNNYRYYTTDQFEQLNTIKYLKDLDMPLSNIKFHLENRSTNNILKLFESQKKVTEEKIRELEFINKKIQNRINQINDSIEYKKLNKIVELDFEDRLVLILKEKVKTFGDLELSIRKLENTSKQNKSSIFLGKVGVSISKEKLKAKLFDEYNSTFIMVEGDNYNQEMLKVLPKGNYVCIRFNGTHYDSDTYYEKILDYINEKSYEIIEDSIEITLIDSGLTTKKSEFVTEIQILVKKY